MRLYDLIKKKRDGNALTKEEIDMFVKAYVRDEIPDYQVSALLMAVYFQGMTDEETANLTMSIAQSGDIIDLSPIKGIKVDKHSTGGVGDKTTLVIAPIVAACGGKVAKISGRGLGHTGGTIDKLESIPDFNTSMEKEDFFKVVNQVGVSVIGQTGNIAPADKKLYALRDVTATVDNIPLIAASIMSKKLAAGSNAILLDVKTGSGAFMKTVAKSVDLAQKMVSIGTHSGRIVSALVTNMDIPLGKNIGNALEVIEAVEILKGKGPDDLRELCLTLSKYMLHMSKLGSLEECEQMAIESINNGSALKKLIAMVNAQGGDSSYILDTSQFPKAKYSHNIIAPSKGYLHIFNTEAIGISSTILGAGRENKDSLIDFAAGIIIEKKSGDYVNKGDTIAIMYSEKEETFQLAENKYMEGCKIQENKPEYEKLIYAIITGKETQLL